MAVGNFPACNVETRRWEGGDVNHPKDPGGLTSRGVTQARGAAYRKAHGLAAKAVTAWSETEVTKFYVDEFWKPLGCDGLAYGVDLATYDAGVNSGPSRARKWLLAAIGGTDIETIKRLCAARLGFVRGLKTWATFGKGWSRRIAGIEARAVAMWLTSVTALDAVEVLDDESDAAAGKSAQQASGAAGSAAVGSGGVAVGAGGGLDWWIIGGLVAVAVAGVVVLVIKARQNRERADAYRVEASRVAIQGV